MNKSLVSAIDEFLLNFLLLVVVHQRTASTLKKWTGTKIKLKDFLLFRYKVNDIALHALEFKGS